MPPEIGKDRIEEQKGNESSHGSSVPSWSKARMHGLKHLGWTSVRLDPQALKLKRLACHARLGVFRVAYSAPASLYTATAKLAAALPRSLRRSMTSSAVFHSVWRLMTRQTASRRGS